MDDIPIAAPRRPAARGPTRGRGPERSGPPVSEERGTTDPSRSTLLVSARRTMLGFYAVAATALWLAIAAAGFADAPEHTGLYAAACVLALALAVVHLRLWRAAVPWNGPAALAVAAVDVALLAAVMVAAGPAHPVTLLVLWIPMVAALVVGPRAVLAVAVVAGTASLLVGTYWDNGFTAALCIAWAASIGLVGARGRRVFWRRLGGFDAMRAALAGDRPVDRVRVRVGDELRIAVLEPITRLRERAEAMTGRAGFASLDRELRTILAATRGILYELHAMSGMAGDLEEALERLVARRAPSAEWSVTIAGDVPRALADELGPVVRDALGLIVDRQTTYVSVHVSRKGNGVELETTATPPPEIDAGTWALRWHTLRDRNGVTHASCYDGDDGIRRLRVRLHGVAGPKRLLAAPGAHYRETWEYVLVSRIGHAVVFAGVWVATGMGGPAAYPYVLGLVCLTLVLTSLVFAGPLTPDSAKYFGVLGLDAVQVAAVFLLADAPMQTALLPVFAFLPATLGAWGRPSVVIGAVTVLTTITVLGMHGGWIVDFPVSLVVIGLSLTTAVGVCEAGVRTRLTGRLTLQMQSHHERLSVAVEREDIERRRLAGLLHDDALQLLLVARQDLEEAGEGDGDPDAARRAIAEIDQARTTVIATVRELRADERPLTFEQQLDSALEHAAGRRGGPDVELEVGAAVVGGHDGLIVQAARELYVNAAKHARAETVRIVVRGLDGWVTLDVFDDGIGMDRARVEDAVSRGHIGLAGIRDQVTSVGGTVQLLGAERGSHVRICLPRTG